jgi:hypothetical protein
MAFAAKPCRATPEDIHASFVIFCRPLLSHSYPSHSLAISQNTGATRVLENSHRDSGGSSIRVGFTVEPVLMLSVPSGSGRA